MPGPPGISDGFIEATSNSSFLADCGSPADWPGARPQPTPPEPFPPSHDSSSSSPFGIVLVKTHKLRNSLRVHCLGNFCLDRTARRRRAHCHLRDLIPSTGRELHLPRVFNGEVRLIGTALRN